MACLFRRTSTVRVMEPRTAQRLNCLRTCARKDAPLLATSLAACDRAGNCRIQRNLGGYYACL
jgi:hypothetical protein